MLKKIILIGIFSLLLTVSFYQNYFLKRNGDYFFSEIKKVEFQVEQENFESALKDANVIFESWNEIKPRYEMLCEHDEVDKIQAAFEEFVILVDQDNILCLTQSALLKYYIDHIVKIDSFSFENIF